MTCRLPGIIRSENQFVRTVGVNNNKNNMQRFAYVGYNYGYLSHWGGTCEPDDQTGVSIAAIQRPSETVAFVDSQLNYNRVPDDRGYSFTNPPNAASYFFPAPDICIFGGGPIGQSGTWNWPADKAEPDDLGFNFPRHNGGMNVVFTDGHVKWMKHQGLAAGTNWGPGVTGEALIVNDKSKFLWDLE